MSFRKTACLATMLMCCTQTAYAAYNQNWDEHLNAQKSADGKTLTSSGFTEVFREGGTQKAEPYQYIYIGHVADQRAYSSETGDLTAKVNNNKAVMGAGVEVTNVYGGYVSFKTSLNGTSCNFEVKENELVLESGSKASSFAVGGYV